MHASTITINTLIIYTEINKVHYCYLCMYADVDIIHEDRGSHERGRRSKALENKREYGWQGNRRE